jgi:glycogen synthase
VKTLILTNEYPPDVYGGAGVHVEYLSRELARLIEVDVRTFGAQDLARERLHVRGYSSPLDLSATDAHLRPVLAAFGRGLAFAADPVTADIVHCHTWYAHLGGVVTKLLYGVPLVITVHSLEPLRPWKREQLAGGYDASSWVERTALEMADAVIAVSKETKRDLTRLFAIDPAKVSILPNGIDVAEYAPTDATDALIGHGIDPELPYVLFVGRITRQKGIVHLVRAIEHMHPSYAVVLCAGAPDTKEIAAEMEQAIAAVRARRSNVHWIAEMVDKPTVRQLYSHAAVFCCPSVYEPFGIINLEAMACETAVVASAVGGIPEVVVDGKTGTLVRFEPRSDSDFEPRDPKRFAHDLARAIDALMHDPARRAEMGRAGRERATAHFGWDAIAGRTVELYRTVLAR